MGRKHKSFPDNDNNHKEKALRKKIKDQEKEIARLKQELKTLNHAFSKTAGYIKGNLDNVTVEKVIQSVRQEKTMTEIKNDNVCPQCSEGEIKSNRLPFGTLRICSAACGFKEVIKDEND